MRLSLPAAFLLSSLLSACAIKGDVPPSKHISQKGALKVHPGLLGQPIPPELQADMPASAGVATVTTPEAKAQHEIRLDGDGLRTQRSVYFDFDSAALKAEHQPMLQAHARYLAQNQKARVRIEGNADERGSSDYNRRLGLKRAEIVRQTLIDHGAPSKHITIRTLGEAQPKIKGSDEASWAENRRADVVYDKGE